MLATLRDSLWAAASQSGPRDSSRARRRVAAERPNSCPLHRGAGCVGVGLRDRAQRWLLCVGPGLCPSCCVRGWGAAHCAVFQSPSQVLPATARSGNQCLQVNPGHGLRSPGPWFPGTERGHVPWGAAVRAPRCPGARAPMEIDSIVPVAVGRACQGHQSTNPLSFSRETSPTELDRTISEPFLTDWSSPGS